MTTLGKLDLSLLKEYGITFFAFLTSGLVNLVIYNQLPHYISIHDTEIFAVYKKTSSLLLVTLIGGMGVTVPKFILENENNISFRILIIGLLFPFTFVLFVLIAFLLLPAFFGHLLIGKRLLFLDTITIFLIITSGIVSNIIFGFFRGLYEVKSASLLIISNAIIQLGCIFISSSVYNYVMLNSILVVACSIGFVFPKSLKEFKKKIPKKPGMVNKMILYGALRVPGDFAADGLTSLPVILTTTTLGIFIGGQMAFAMTILGLVISIMSPINFILLPQASKAINQGRDITRIKMVVKQSLLIAFPIILIISIITAFYAKWIAIHVFHSNYPNVLEEYIRYMSIAVMFYFVYSFLRGILDAGYKYPVNSLTCTFALIVFGICYFLFRNMNNGILLSVIIAYFCLACFTYYFYLKLLKRLKS